MSAVARANKFHAVKTTADGITFDSKAEAYRETHREEIREKRRAWYARKKAEREGLV